MRPHWLRKKKNKRIACKHNSEIKRRENNRGKEIEMQTTSATTSTPRVNNLNSDEWLTSPSIIFFQSLCLEIP
jgi:hypothetical protein